MSKRDSSIELEPTDGGYRTAVADHENPSEAVVRGAMTLTDAQLSEIEPLYDRVDPESLDAVFEDTRTTRRGTIYFEYCGCEVVVEDGERIVFRPLESGPDVAFGAGDGASGYSNH